MGERMKGVYHGHVVHTHFYVILTPSFARAYQDQMPDVTWSMYVIASYRPSSIMQCSRKWMLYEVCGRVACTICANEILCVLKLRMSVFISRLANSLMQKKKCGWK